MKARQKVLLDIRIDPSFKADLVEQAEDHNMKLSEFVREILEGAFEIRNAFGAEVKRLKVPIADKPEKPPTKHRIKKPKPAPIAEASALDELF